MTFNVHIKINCCEKEKTKSFYNCWAKNEKEARKQAHIIAFNYYLDYCTRNGLISYEEFKLNSYARYGMECDYWTNITFEKAYMMYTHTYLSYIID